MRRRPGFTLVELLVAMALILFIMVILTEAFSAGLETFRRLKAIGDMQEKMRSAAIVLRRDLGLPHFKNINDARSHLSEFDLRTQPPPDAGYFRIFQITNPANVPPNAPPWVNNSDVVEGTEDNISQTRSWTHHLQFTVVQAGLSPDAYYRARLPAGDATGLANTPSQVDLQQPGTMSGRWAEVTYFLRAKTGQTTTGDNPQQLYSLYRRVRVLGEAPFVAGAVTVTNPALYPDVSFGPTPDAAGNYYLNDATSLTQPKNRFGMAAAAPGSPQLAGVPAFLPPVGPTAIPNAGGWTLEELLGPTNAQAGDDLLLTDVIGFDVKVLQQGYTPGGALQDPQGITMIDLPPASVGLNSTFAALGWSVFDTWSADPTTYAGWNVPGTATSLPLKLRILAVQITLRVWDARTEQARQMSVIVDL
jgi:prepilin-type N-terminal cleavage/methylation domain-containing protein